MRIERIVGWLSFLCAITGGKKLISMKKKVTYSFGKWKFPSVSDPKPLPAREPRELSLYIPNAGPFPSQLWGSALTHSQTPGSCKCAGMLKQAPGVLKQQCNPTIKNLHDIYTKQGEKICVWPSSTHTSLPRPWLLPQKKLNFPWSRIFQFLPSSSLIGLGSGNKPPIEFPSP